VGGGTVEVLGVALVVTVGRLVGREVLLVAELMALAKPGAAALEGR
jgi:hypothetical protein